MNEPSPASVARILSTRLLAQLGSDIESVIAHGSWIHGDFCPGRSDLDLIVVLRREPDADVIDAVQPILDQVIEDCPAWRDRLELGFVTGDAMRAVIAGDEDSHHVGRVSPGEPLHLVPADRHRLLDWEAARHGRTLEGRSAVEAIPDIPDHLVREVVSEHLRRWPAWLTESSSVGYQAYAVLTVSRAAAYLDSGIRHSKRAGAEWAGTRFPRWRRLTDWAIAWWYAGRSDDDMSPVDVPEFIDEVADLVSVSESAIADIAMALLVDGDKMLLAHRHPARRWYPDCWDLIGGHIEPGESAEEAVRRECREEIGVEILEWRPVEVDLEAETFRAHAYVASRWSGQPVNAAPDEHDELGWFTGDQLDGLHLAHPKYASWLPSLMSEAQPEQ